MSTHIIGFRKPDEVWEKMKAVYDACEEAAIAIPDAVQAFFGGEEPDDRGVSIDLEDSAGVEEYGAEGVSGFEVAIKDIPSHITHIRFFNAW
jgi:hypothetical protein